MRVSGLKVDHIKVVETHSERHVAARSHTNKAAAAWRDQSRLNLAIKLVKWNDNVDGDRARRRIHNGDMARHVL